jgi:two-component system, LytTR family, sensor kinase
LNPPLSNRFPSKAIWLIYILIWMVLAAIQFTLLTMNFHLGFWLTLSETLVYNTIFAILSSGIWFTVRYSGRIGRGWLETVSYHLAGMAFTILIWQGVGYQVMKLISGNDAEYMFFLRHSISYRILAGVLIYLLILSVYYLVLNVRELRERIEREASLTAMLREAEINKLRAQIKPHFLFNSLNSVSSLTMTDPSKAQEMVIKLSEFMRYSLSMGEESMSTLNNELYHVGLYLDIEKVRFSDRLNVVKEIGEECLNCPIPAMILQPLLENAVKHGVYTLAGPSVVAIRVRCDAEFLHIHISNEYEPDAAPRKGTGTGLQNVIKRMATIYNRLDLISIQKDEHQFNVMLKIPIAVK